MNRSRWRPMQSRDPHQSHRAATPLELFFDLCFVVAIALAASKLHHGLAHGEIWHSIQAYALVFFAIWWAWVNFTWFASAYDVDDVPYRLNIFVQMAGVLLLAAGVPRAFEHSDFGLVTIGYVIMRIALIAQWLRAARSDPARRRTAQRYATGLFLCQLGWIALLFLPQSWRLLAWIVLVPAELLVPAWAEHAQRTNWHPHHIAERYGLLTLIVLGESVLASTFAIQAAADAAELATPLATTILGALLTLFSMWWLYFDVASGPILSGSSNAFRWGYAHYFVFGSIAAVGAGLAFYVDFLSGEAHVSQRLAAAPWAGAVALYLLLIFLMQLWSKRQDRIVANAQLLAAVGVLLACLAPTPILAGGLVLATLVGVQIWRFGCGAGPAST